MGLQKQNTATAQKKLWEELERLTSRRHIFNDRGWVVGLREEKDMPEIIKLLCEDEAFRKDIAQYVSRKIENLHMDADNKRHPGTFSESSMSVSFINQHGAKIHIGPGEY